MRKHKKHDNLTWHRDVIKIRRLLSRMQYHTQVCYHGPLMLWDGVKLGEDYEFYDAVCKDWDTPRAFIPHSPTKNFMKKIIAILEKHQVPRGFVLTKWCWYIQR